MPAAVRRFSRSVFVLAKLNTTAKMGMSEQMSAATPDGMYFSPQVTNPFPRDNIRKPTRA